MVSSAFFETKPFAPTTALVACSTNPPESWLEYAMHGIPSAKNDILSHNRILHEKYGNL